MTLAKQFVVQSIAVGRSPRRGQIALQVDDLGSLVFDRGLARDVALEMLRHVDKIPPPPKAIISTQWRVGDATAENGEQAVALEMNGTIYLLHASEAQKLFRRLGEQIDEVNRPKQ